MTKANALKQAEMALRKFALAFPEATEDFPWGHTAIKVKGKVFLFMSTYDGKLSLSMKLPVSSKLALQFPFASSTGYGLGKSGWVTVEFEAKDPVPVDLLKEWVDESYRAIAPKKLVAGLEAEDVGGKPKRGVKAGKKPKKSGRER